MSKKVVVLIIFSLVILVLAVLVLNPVDVVKNKASAIENPTLETTQEKDDEDVIENGSTIKDSIKPKTKEQNIGVNDTIYKWDDKNYKWVEATSTLTSEKDTASFHLKNQQRNAPLKIDWFLLENIQYKLGFFEELDIEAYTPVFSDVLKTLHKKEVIITGYVIPVFEDEGPLALSANPYASCFFCGQASPASVMSMYMKTNSKRYKADDYKSFKGTLFLNYDDPNEFYYILKNAVEWN